MFGMAFECLMIEELVEVLQGAATQGGMHGILISVSKVVEGTSNRRLSKNAEILVS